MGDKEELLKKHQLLIDRYYDVKNYSNLRSISDSLGISIGTLKSRIAYLRDRDVIRKDRGVTLSNPTKESVSEYKDELVSQETKRLVSEGKDQLIKQLIRERVRTQVVAEACEAAILKLKIDPFPIPKVRESASRASMHVLFSDAQIGQFAEDQWLSRNRGYTFENFCKRLEKFGEKIVLFHKIYSRSFQIPKLVVNMLGDIVEGEGIFKNQAYQLDRVVVDQVFDGQAKIAEWLLMLAQVFPQIEVFGVWGNHGRVGKKGEHPDKCNWDYVLMRNLSALVRNQSNVQIFISESPQMLVQHGSYTFFLNHGDQVKSWNGIPFYGLDRMCYKLPGLTGKIVNYVLVGHFHRHAQIEIPGGMLLANGSFPGGCYYSETRLFETSRPSQLMFLFHDEEGIHSESHLVLDSLPDLVPDEHGIMTSYLNKGDQEWQTSTKLS